MKNLYAAILLLLLSFCSIAQTYQGPLPYTTTSTTFGGNTVTVTPINSPCQGSQCGIPMASGYWSGCTVPNGFGFSFANPLSDIRLKIAGINDGETLKIKINNNVYPLTPSMVSAFTGSCSSPLAGTANVFTAMGELTSTQPTTGTADNAQIDIHIGQPIYSFEVLEDVVSGGGSVFEVYFVNDTCFTNNTKVTAIASQYTCHGDTLFLNANTLNGASYHWYGPNGFFSSSKDTFITNVTTTHSGTYIVEADRGICHYADDTLVTVVNPPIPTSTTNNGPKCAGTDIDFSTAPIAGVTYRWTGPANFSTTSTDGDTTRHSVPPTGDGWYYVRTIKNGCLSKPDSTKVTLLFPTAPPTAGGNTVVCPGTTLNLTASNISGATYNWTGPGNFSSTQQNPPKSNITFADSGYYYVTATVNGCISQPDSIKIDVKILTPTPSAGGDTIVCPGTTLHLAASNIPNATYAWLGPGSFTSTSQNPLKPNIAYADSGYYYVKATVLGCTSLPDTIKIAVKITTPTPEAGGDSVVCPGTELNLAASAIANATYSWTGPGFTAQAQNPSLPSVTTTAEGIYTVTATVNGCTSLPDSVSIKVRITTPTPEAGSDSPVCSDGELRLTASDVPNATYSWSGPRITSTQQNPVTIVWMEDAGAYVVTANVDGCISLPDTIMVTIKERPVLNTSTNSPVCEHDTLSIIADSEPTSSETTYSWTGPEGFTSTAAHLDLADAKLQQSGMYIVTATMNGCISRPDTLMVQVDETLPNPIADASPVFNGEKLQLTGKGLVPGMKFNWAGPNNFTSTEENPIIDPTTEFAEGLYILTTTLGGCSSSDSTFVKVKFNKHFTLYPNPNNGNFVVKGDIQKDQKIKIEIISSTGQTIYRHETTTENKHLRLPIQMAGLPNGAYLIRMEIDGKTKDMRFVVSQ